jgi:hypothetical protein
MSTTITDNIPSPCPRSARPAASSEQLILRSQTGHLWAVHVECYPDEQLLRVRKKGGGTAILDRLTPREAVLARISATGLQLVAVAHMKAAGLWSASP